MTKINTKLNGSAKQVAWAEDIRANIVAKLDEALASMESRLSAEQYAAYKANWDNMLWPAIESVDSAEWYITHRRAAETSAEETTQYIVLALLRK